jgi:hypothetical protein
MGGKTDQDISTPSFATAVWSFAMPESNPSTTSTKNDVWDKLLRGVQSAVELRVITVVGGVKLGGKLAAPEIQFGEDGAKPTSDAIVTSINLVEGDITNIVPDQFWSPDKEVIRKYHEQQVSNGHDIVSRNLRLISEVGEALIRTLSNLKNLEKSNTTNS